MWRPESCQEGSRHFRHAGAWPRNRWRKHLGLIRGIKGRLPPVIGGSREEVDGTGERGREAARKAQETVGLDLGKSVQEGTGGAREPFFLFETHPDVQKLFPKFVGLSKEQLQNNPGVQAHGEIVVCKLTEILKANGEHKEILKALAESHAKQHKIPLVNFQTHPDVQKLFPKFVGLSKEQLQNNPAVQAHGEIVVCKLTEILKANGEHKEILKALAESHAKQHKIPLVNFQIISEVIVMVAAEKLDRFGPDAKTALKNVLKTIQIDLGACYEELGFKE
ncbi:MYG protein, partial [Polypterus senegalus]